MKESEWVSVNDMLPGFDKKVTLRLFDGTIGIGKLGCEQGSITMFLFDDDAMGSRYYNRRKLEGVIEWRPIQEKRPDFSKLRNGDPIILHLESLKKIGFFYRIDKNWDICMTAYDDSQSYTYTNLAFVKKITHINLEEKTFEEI